MREGGGRRLEEGCEGLWNEGEGRRLEEMVKGVGWRMGVREGGVRLQGGGKREGGGEWWRRKGARGWVEEGERG